MEGRRQKCTPHLLHAQKQKSHIFLFSHMMTSDISEKKSLRNNKDGKTRALPKNVFSAFFALLSPGVTLWSEAREGKTRVGTWPKTERRWKV